MMYVILSPAMGSMKIGVSKRPDERLKTLQSAFPLPLEITYVIPKGGFKEEKRFHCELRHYRTHGEWFKVTAESMQMLVGLLREYEFLDSDQWTRFLDSPAILRGPWEEPPPPEAKTEPRFPEVQEDDSGDCSKYPEEFFRLPSIARHLYLTIDWLCGKDDPAPDLAQAAKIMGYSKSMATNAYRHLEKHGLTIERIASLRTPPAAQQRADLEAWIAAQAMPTPS